MAVFYYLYCIVFTLVFSNELKHGERHNLKDKRILIQDVLDITNEFAKLNKRLDEQQIEIRNLTNMLYAKETEVETLKIAMEHLNKGSASGSTYTRWGRTTCPGNNTELVYKGYMGGAPYITNGGAVNFLCLSEDPQWDHYDVSIHAGTKITGVEYEFYGFRNQDGASQFFGKNIYNENAPCAVCHSERGASIMIPGRTECYGGWTKEYSGYIVGEFDTSPRQSELICLDRRPDVIAGGKNNDNEALLYMVEASCGGSMECPPYIQGREITCVVCTK